MSAVWERHLLQNVSPGSAQKAILWTRDRGGEGTSSVTVKVDGKKKNTGCGILLVISFHRQTLLGI